MKQRKIAVIAGTSDATDWIRSLPETDSVTAFVATPYGKEILAGTNCTVHVGRLDAAGFAEALTGFDEVVDASHPVAVVVTETVKAVCQAKQIPYTRISRPTLHYDYEKLHIVSSKEAAADWLCSCTGNLFFTVGIQDTAASRQAAAAIPATFWFAMPPYSIAETVAYLQEHQISVLVSKDSGARGGVPEKIQAAKQVGIPVLLIQSPEQK